MLWIRSRGTDGTTRSAAAPPTCSVAAPPTCWAAARKVLEGCACNVLRPSHRSSLRHNAAMRLTAVAVLLLLFTARQPPPASSVPLFGYTIVHVYPHDPDAFTQGLQYVDGVLYEGTGMNGRSSIRKVKLETGEVLQRRDVPAQHFG